MEITLVKMSMLSNALVACLLTFSAYGADSVTSGTVHNDSVAMDSVMIYLKQQQADRAAIEFATAPIKSQSALQAFLSEQRASPSPLDALSPQAKQRFIASLQFNDRGITSFEYRDLEEELTPYQIYQILSLFGAQHDTAMMKNARIGSAIDRQIVGSSWWIIGIGEDHDDYKCDSQNPHTCVKSINAICTSNC